MGPQLFLASLFTATRFHSEAQGRSAAAHPGFAWSSLVYAEGVEQMQMPLGLRSV